jgi:hypothetical protein
MPGLEPEPTDQYLIRLDPDPQHCRLLDYVTSQVRNCFARTSLLKKMERKQNFGLA